jgi:hypothetical protein
MIRSFRRRSVIVRAGAIVLVALVAVVGALAAGTPDLGLGLSGTFQINNPAVTQGRSPAGFESLPLR